MLTIPLRILNVFQALACFALTVAGISLCAVAMLLGMRPTVALYAAHRPWADVILWLCGARLRAPSPDQLPDGPHLYVANHSSVIDIPVLFKVMRPPLRFIAKKQLFALPIFGWYLRATDMVPIDRADVGEARRSLSTLGEKLEQGTSIVAFPEGTRSRDGSIGAFKRGTIVTAIRLQIPIVPVAIHNAANVVHRNGFSGRPGTIRVAVGDPIPTEGLRSADRIALAEAVRNAVIVLHEGIELELRGRHREPAAESLRGMAGEE